MVCIYVCVYPYRVLVIFVECACVCVWLYVFCAWLMLSWNVRNRTVLSLNPFIHLYKSKWRCPIKWSRDLKGFNFIITRFRSSWDIQSGNIFMFSLWWPRPGSRKDSPLHIYKYSQSVREIQQGETRKVTSSLKIFQSV